MDHHKAAELRTESMDREYAARHNGQRFDIGDKVRIRGDGDGADGVVATIGKIYKSGRFRVDLPDGGFRNLPHSCLELLNG